MIRDHIRRWAERALTDEIVSYAVTVIHPDGRTEVFPEVTRRDLSTSPEWVRQHRSTVP